MRVTEVTKTKVILDREKDKVDLKKEIEKRKKNNLEDK